VPPLRRRARWGQKETLANRRKTPDFMVFCHEAQQLGGQVLELVLGRPGIGDTGLPFRQGQRRQGV